MSKTHPKYYQMSKSFVSKNRHYSYWRWWIRYDKWNKTDPKQNSNKSHMDVAHHLYRWVFSFIDEELYHFGATTTSKGSIRPWNDSNPIILKHICDQSRNRRFGRVLLHLIYWWWCFGSFRKQELGHLDVIKATIRYASKVSPRAERKKKRQTIMTSSGKLHKKLRLSDLLFPDPLLYQKVVG